MWDGLTNPFVLYHFVRDSKILPSLENRYHRQTFLLFKISCCIHSLEHIAARHKPWGWTERCSVWHKMVGVHHVVVTERRGSCAYVDSPGNVALRAHGGWTACHRCHSWRSVRPSGWSGASWACAGAWRCSYSGGTWAYWWLGVRPRLDRDRNTRPDLVTCFSARSDFKLYILRIDNCGLFFGVLSCLKWLEQTGNKT